MRCMKWEGLVEANHDNMLPRGGSNSIAVLIVLADYARIIVPFNAVVPLRRADIRTFPHTLDIASLRSSHRLSD